MGNEIGKIIAMVSEGFSAAPKKEDGSISKSDALKLLQEMKTKTSGIETIFAAKNVAVSDYERLSIYDDFATNSWGYAAATAQNIQIFPELVDSFTLATDEDSEGGKDITAKEQEDILKSLNVLKTRIDEISNEAKKSKNLIPDATQDTKKIMH